MNEEKKRCIMLYDDAHGMGHLPFFQYLCESLKDEYELFVLLGNGLSDDYFSGAKVIRIQKKSNTELYNVSRIKQIEHILFRIRPNMFLIDFFPFGRYGNILEINLITSFIKNSGGKNISIMRDIYLGKKILTTQSYKKFLKTVHDIKGEDISSVIENDYQWLFDIIFKGKVHHIFLIQAYLSYTILNNIIDGILVFGDKNIFDISEEFILNDGEDTVFHHLGYIPESTSIDKHLEHTKKSILISTGGNVTSKADFERLIGYINTLEGYSIRILLGPYVEREYKKKIISIVHGNKNIIVTGFVKNFSKLLHGSTYFFGFGGYGTFQSLFAYTGKAFIMSNYDDQDFKHRYYEQKYRTIHLTNFLNIYFLSDFSFKNLDICMRREKKHIIKKKIDFCTPLKLMNVINKITTTNK